MAFVAQAIEPLRAAAWVALPGGCAAHGRSVVIRCWYKCLTSGQAFGTSLLSPSPTQTTMLYHCLQGQALRSFVLIRSDPIAGTWILSVLPTPIWIDWLPRLSVHWRLLSVPRKSQKALGRPCTNLELVNEQWCCSKFDIISNSLNWVTWAAVLFFFSMVQHAFQQRRSFDTLRFDWLKCIRLRWCAERGHHRASQSQNDNFLFWFPSLMKCFDLGFKSARSHKGDAYLMCWAASKLHAASRDAKSKVPDQSGALPTHSLHVDLLCSSHLCGEGLPWAAFRGRDYYVCLRTRIYDGQVWSSPRQVHGLLHDVPRSLFWSSVWKGFWLIHRVVLKQ